MRAAWRSRSRPKAPAVPAADADRRAAGAQGGGAGQRAQAAGGAGGPRRGRCCRCAALAAPHAGRAADRGTPPACQAQRVEQGVRLAGGQQDRLLASGQAPQHHPLLSACRWIITRSLPPLTARQQQVCGVLLTMRTRLGRLGAGRCRQRPLKLPSAARDAGRHAQPGADAQAGSVREALGVRLQPTSRSGSMLASGGRRTLLRTPSTSRWAAVRPALPLRRCRCQGVRATPRGVLRLAVVCGAASRQHALLRPQQLLGANMICRRALTAASSPCRPLQLVASQRSHSGVQRCWHGLACSDHHTCARAGGDAAAGRRGGGHRQLGDHAARLPDQRGFPARRGQLFHVGPRGRPSCQDQRSWSSRSCCTQPNA